MQFTEAVDDETRGNVGKTGGWFAARLDGWLAFVSDRRRLNEKTRTNNFSYRETLFTHFLCLTIFFLANNCLRFKNDFSPLPSSSGAATVSSVWMQSGYFMLAVAVCSHKQLFSVHSHILQPLYGILYPLTGIVVHMLETIIVVVLLQYGTNVIDRYNTTWQRTTHRCNARYNMLHGREMLFGACEWMFKCFYRVGYNTICLQLQPIHFHILMYLTLLKKCLKYLNTGTQCGTIPLNFLQLTLHPLL